MPIWLEVRPWATASPGFFTITRNNSLTVPLKKCMLYHCIDLHKDTSYDVKVVAVYGKHDVASDPLTVVTSADTSLRGTLMD